MAWLISFRAQLAEIVFSVARWCVSVGDALSQLAGRFIPVRVDGAWTTWTANANESISGAAWRHYQSGRYVRVRRVIDFVIFWENSHCRESYRADVERARETVWPEH